MRTARVLIGVTLLGVWCAAVQGQESFERVNSHFGAIGSFPLHPIGTYTGIGWGLLGGAGYNFSRRHSAIGEFMWTRLAVTDAALRQLQQATGQNVSGHSNLYVMTGNYRYEWRRATFVPMSLLVQVCITALQIHPS